MFSIYDHLDVASIYDSILVHIMFDDPREVFNVINHKTLFWKKKKNGLGYNKQWYIISILILQKGNFFPSINIFLR